MRVLVACEYSGVVRDAFAARGHDAWSCDILPTEAPGNHYQGDARDMLEPDRWDLLIAHPPCTYLANSGVQWLHLRPERWDLMREGAAFPLLAYEDAVAATAARPREERMPGWWGGGGGKRHGHVRSKTARGIGDAMAVQWGVY